MPTLFADDRPIPAAGYARVAVERGVDRYPDGLTYIIPHELADIQPGQRVIVPLGRGNTPTASYVIDIADSTTLDVAKLKSIAKRDDAAVRLPNQLVQLARWISNYYCAPIGMTLASMLPAAVKRNVGSVTKTLVDLGDPLPLDEKLPPKQRIVLETLAAMESIQRPVEIRTLADRALLKTTGPIKKLIERGLLETSKRTAVEALWSSHATDATKPDQLTEPQQNVINTIDSTLGHGFGVHLLYGVTGSGKTEVYIRLIERVIAMGKTALLLVPEISLTPQTGGRLLGRFPDQRVAILHSGLTAAQRHQHWVMASEGKAQIVLGARSAVFAPIPDEHIGLIIVDEEHDGSYKQDQVPRYHGRDVAIRRAQLARCPILLGSATPSLESWHNATRSGQGGYSLHRLSDRVPGAQLPVVKVVDFREQQRAHQDRRVHLIGPVLQGALGRTLDAGAQALILLNRRGYANYIACPDYNCAWTMQCDHCDVTMVYHLNKSLPKAGAGYVRCHHCLAEQKLPATCPDCHKRISTFGLGTQRVEEELHRMFPMLVEGETMLRVDSDTMHGAKDFHDALGRFGSGQLRVLVGTQMIAKGLDYPGVRLVGVINADTSINLPDFRATERTFQLVSQVAGRSGRGSERGLVIVQTFNPGVPSIQLAARHDFERFAQVELAQRKQGGLPPLSRMTRIVVRDEDHLKCLAMAKTVAERLRTLAGESVRVRGPAPCPIARIAGKHRQQIELLAPTAGVMQKLLAAARSEGAIKAGAAMAIDVDPIALL